MLGEQAPVDDTGLERQRAEQTAKWTSASFFSSVDFSYVAGATEVLSCVPAAGPSAVLPPPAQPF